MQKTLIMTGLFVGSIVGGYIPALWGGSVFSISSILFSALGAFLGIWVGYKAAQRLGV
jgi:hypothetical protein